MRGQNRSLRCSVKARVTEDQERGSVRWKKFFGSRASAGRTIPVATSSCSSSCSHRTGVSCATRAASVEDGHRLAARDRSQVVAGPVLHLSDGCRFHLARIAFQRRPLKLEERVRRL